MTDLSSQLNPSGCGKTLYLTPDLSKKDTRDKASIVLCSSLDYECGDNGLPLCELCSAKRLATAKALYNEKKKTLEFCEKLKDKFCINLDGKGKRVFKDYRVAVCCGICNVINNEMVENLESEIKQIENEVPEVKQ